MKGPVFRRVQRRRGGRREKPMTADGCQHRRAISSSHPADFYSRSAEASADVISLWERAGIPTKLKKDVIKKIENKFNEWQKLKKKENKVKRSEGLRNKEKEWQDNLEYLFDIAHADALNKITIEEDKLF
ncbi:hypothetical protein EVAR_55363_1 [Eumeta japonica]|uniref:Uncharacterized protein n=1 Tax=Eumeta variegata TaxID=151549 RepID=A0A4C1YY90_EUMVA|nr:hypothetical protein EVAR_55363_1 [Eumeta japonica]